MGLKIIVTAGPTNERIDSVMKITNMSTGSLGSTVADALIFDESFGEHIERLYYISPKLARKPVSDDGRITYVQIESAEDLKRELEFLLTTEKIDMVVHSAAVGDYKARYSVRAESLAKEIDNNLFGAHTADREQIILNVLKDPKCVADDSGKMSSYEPNLMTMMDLTPKVIGTIKDKSPDTLLIGFKLLDGVSREKLINVAAKLREKNDADYIIANDLSKIRDGEHPAIFVGRNGVERKARDKQGIADGILDIAKGLVVGQTKPEEPAGNKQVVFVSIDKPSNWSQWHSGSTNIIYRSEILENETQIEQFKQKVKEDYPDSNLTDEDSDHKWYITFAGIRLPDENNFKALCDMMNVYKVYESPKK